MGMGAHQREAALAEEQQKSLELEEYHHRILEADWLLELEVRPTLIQRIDVVRGTCRSACAPWSAYQGGWWHFCSPGCCTGRAGHPGGNVNLVGLGTAIISPVQTNGLLVWTFRCEEEELSSGEWERKCFLTWQSSLWVMDTTVQPN